MRYCDSRANRKQERLPHVWRAALSLMFAATPLTPGALAAAETKYFRSDAGIADSTAALPNDFGPSANMVWRQKLDSGHSTPLLHSGKIFLTTYRPTSKELASVALDEATGRELWRNPVMPEHVEETHPLGSPAT